MKVFFMALALAIFWGVVATYSGGSDKTVIYGVTAIFLVVLLGGLFGSVVYRMWNGISVNLNGELCQATVRSVETTGYWLNNKPEIRMRLLVHGQGGASSEATLKVYIDLADLPKYQPEKTIEVVRSRERPEKVVLKEENFDELQQRYRQEKEKKMAGKVK